MSDAAPRPWIALAFALGAWLLVVAARATAPDDLLTRDQERVAAYVLDVVENGRWLAQDDAEGNFASKPPLFNWLAVLGVLALGDTGRIAMAFPSWFATLLTTLLVLATAARSFGRNAGIWAALFYFASMLGLRQVLILRTDGLFQLFVFAATLFAFDAFERRRTWLPFWIAATLATMTKGPLVLVLGTLGLLAFVRERPFRLRWREHAIGVAILVSVCGAWFVAANIATDGRAWQKLIVDELVGHTLGTRENASPPGLHPYRAPAWFLSRLFPMSLFAIVAFVRVLRRRATAEATAEAPSRFERLFTVQCLASLAMFAFASEHRFEQLMPLVPGAAILAGHEVALRWRASADPRAHLAALGALAACAFGYLHLWDANTPAMVQSRHVAELAEELRPHFRGEERLLRLDAPRGLFSQLGCFEAPIGADALRERLADPSQATWLAVVDETGVAAPLRPLLRRPFGADASITVMSNRDALPVAQSRPPRPWPGLACFGLGLAASAAFAMRKTLATLRASAP